MSRLSLSRVSHISPFSTSSFLLSSNISTAQIVKLPIMKLSSAFPRRDRNTFSGLFVCFIQYHAANEYSSTVYGLYYDDCFEVTTYHYFCFPSVLLCKGVNFHLQDDGGQKEAQGVPYNRFSTYKGKRFYGTYM